MAKHSFKITLWFVSLSNKILSTCEPKLEGMKTKIEMKTEIIDMKMKTEIDMKPEIDMKT